MLAACLLAFMTGFLSLSLEILWIRLFGFANHSLPQAFAFVLIFYLLGIALGARIGKVFCLSSCRLWVVSGVVLVLSSFSDLASPLLYAQYAHSSAQLWLGGGLIMLTALLKAIVFPVAHHLGLAQRASRMGRNLSLVYVANIFGATLGPLFAGIVLLSFFTTQQSFVICAALAFAAGIYCLSRESHFYPLAAGVLLASCVFSLAWLGDSHGLITKTANPLGLINRIVENQYGIITVYQGGKAGDIVTGGNVYDGRTNLDPVINSNGINRVIVLSTLQSKPERVLMIGLSIGSWLKIATSFPDVKQIDVIEINPGYLTAMQDYPAQQSALRDARVHLYIDDGRRWLKAHPHEQYDMVIMNTTYYWRAYSTNLLSREFLTLVKGHMRKNAVLTYNTTGSFDVLKTAVSVFDHAYLYGNFVIAADFDWRDLLRGKAAAKKMAALSLDGKPLFPAGSERVIQGYLKETVVPIEVVQPLYEAFGRPLEVVTDRNLITEYKYGERLR